MVLLMLRMRVNFVVLLMLMRVHFLVLLMLPVRVHFVVLLMLLVGVHLVVLLMRLQFVAGGVGQHRLQQVWRLAGLIGGRVHEGRSRLRLRVLLLDLRRFPRVRDFCTLL